MLCSIVLAGDAQGGGSPLVGGAGRTDACQPLLLARSVLRRGGNLTRPGLPLGETGKGDQIPCCRRLILFRCNQFSTNCHNRLTAAPRPTSIRTLIERPCARCSMRSIIVGAAISGATSTPGRGRWAGDECAVARSRRQLRIDVDAILSSYSSTQQLRES